MGLTFFGGNKVPSKTHNISDINIESTLIYTGICAFSGIVLRSNMFADIIVNIYDGIDNTGKHICLPDLVLRRKASNDIWTLNYDPPIECLTGIFIDINVPTGGAVHYQVIYEEG